MSVTGPPYRLDDLLRRHRDVLESSLPEHSLKQSEDLSLPEFLAGQRRGWSEEELNRLNRSEYAAHLQFLTWRVEPPCLKSMALWALGRMQTFQTRALQRFASERDAANQRRHCLEADLKSLTNRLAALPPVAPLELVAARNKITDAEEARAAARAEVDRLVQVEFEARAYQELRQRLQQAKAQLLRVGGVLADAGAIEKPVDRLRELREVYPRLREIAVSRGQAAQAEDAIARLNDERLRQTDDLAAKEAALRQAKEKRTTVQNQIARDETANREVSEKLRELTRLLDKLAECERHEADLGRVRGELARLPADPHTLLSVAREGYDEIDRHARVVPLLTRFAARRQELGKAVEHEKAVEATLVQVRALAEARKKEADDLRPRLEQAKAELERASERATEAKTLLTQAKQSLADLTQIDGSTGGRSGGPPLTEGHLAEEKKRRARDVAQAMTRADAADEALKVGRRVEQELRQQVESADRFVQTSRDEYRDGLAQQKQARAAVERMQGECATLYGDLPDEFRARVGAMPPADWLQTSYPAAADVEQLKARANGLAEAKRKKAEAEETARKYDQLKAREAAALENLERLSQNLPADRQRLRTEHAELDARAKALFQGIDAGRAAVQQVEREIDRLTRERDGCQKKIAETDGKLTDANLTRQNAQRNLAAQTRELPEVWRPRAETMGIRELDLLDEERKKLERDGTDDKARDLEAARNSLSAFEQDVRDLEAKEAACPAEAKQEPAAIALALKEAKYRDTVCDGELSQARKQLALLESYEKQRPELDDEYMDTKKELTRLGLGSPSWLLLLPWVRHWVSRWSGTGAAADEILRRADEAFFDAFKSAPKRQSFLLGSAGGGSLRLTIPGPQITLPTITDGDRGPVYLVSTDRGWGNDRLEVAFVGGDGIVQVPVGPWKVSSWGYSLATTLSEVSHEGMARSLGEDWAIVCSAVPPD